MKLALLQRDVGLISRLVPALTTLLCVMISVLPAHLPAFAAATPFFTLMAVYFWTLYHPDLLPFALVFAMGLLLDVVDGAPLGISSLILLLAHASVLSQREYLVMRGFTGVWGGFLVVAAGAMALQWGVVSLFYGMFVDARAFLFEGVLTVAVYPVVSYLLARIQRTLLMRA